MKVYKQNEWVKIVNDHEEVARGCKGHYGIGNINFDKNRKIVSVESQTNWGMTLSCYGQTTLEYLSNYIDGKLAWQIEEDNTLSVVSDGEPVNHIKIEIPKIEIKKPVVIKFEKWFKDYCTQQHQKFVHYDESYGYKTEFDGFTIGNDGCIKSIRVMRITDYNWKMESNVDVVDVVVHLYGMCRKDILDEWRIRPVSYTDPSLGLRGHVYFNENFDVVFDNDGEFYVNKGYGVYSGDERVYFPEIDFL